MMPDEKGYWEPNWHQGHSCQYADLKFYELRNAVEQLLKYERGSDDESDQRKVVKKLLGIYMMPPTPK